MKKRYRSLVQALSRATLGEGFTAFGWRVLILSGVTSFVTWWFVFNYLGVNKEDPFSYRVGIMASAFVMVWLSYFFREVKNNLPGIFICWSWLVTVYHFHLVVQNDLNIYYVSGLFILVSLVSHFYSSLKGFAAYSLLVVLNMLILTWQLRTRITGDLEKNYFFLSCGILTCLGIFFLSVMAKRRLQRYLEIQREQIFKESKWVSMGKLAGTIAHEVNTPLAVISLSLEQLRDVLGQNNQLGSVTDRILVRAEATTVRVANIVKSLKIFSRTEQSQTGVALSLSKIMEDVEMFLRQAVKSTDIKVRIVQNVEGPYTLICQKSDLLQVLVNLINNAREAVKACADKQIGVIVDNIEQGIQFIVEDTGPGVPPALSEKMFDEFITSGHVGGGSGIGLGISKRIATQYGGRLTYTRKDGRTQFTFWVPQRFERNDSAHKKIA